MLFRTPRPQLEPFVTTMLRHMEHGEFVEAFKALRRGGPGPVPPPHALWRLGRWLLEQERPKDARLPLKRFLEIYRAHQDRAAVERDLAAARGR